MRIKKQEIDDCISQLKSLVDDRNSFLNGDPDHDDVFIEDAKALKLAIAIIEDWRKDHED